MKAPQFSLPDQEGIIHNLSDYSGKWIVLFFYPKDDTPGCTKEACNFRDSYDQLQKRGVVVLGVSKDNANSHKKFIDKYKLNYPLLSDESTEMMKSYGVWGEKKFMGKSYMGISRMTFLINPKGDFEKTYQKVDPAKHITEIMTDLENLGI